MKNLHLGISVLILFASFQIHATDYNWVGGSGSWNNANNWSPIGIPNTGDVVDVFNGTVTIPDWYDAYADKVNIWQNGAIKIKKKGELFLSDPSSPPLAIYGLMTNKGKIYCQPTGGIPSSSVHISDSGTLLQTSSAKLYCESFSFAGILNLGILDNRGTIDIRGDDAGGTGISNQPNSTVLNSASGKIYIYDTSGHGFALSTSNPFTNYGRIIIDSDEMYVGFSINSGAFINENYLLVIGGEGFGLRLSNGLALTNNGEINLASSFGNGASILGTFINGLNGEFKVQNSEDIGLHISSVGTFENYGTTTIFGTMDNVPFQNEGVITNEGFLKIIADKPSGTNQFENFNSLTNLPCGEIKYTKEFLNTPGASILNQGFWTSYNPASDINNGTFTNEGVLADPYGSFDGITFTNDGQHLTPILGTSCITQTVYDGIAIGSNPTHTVLDLYNHEKYNTIAGIYYEPTNKIFLNVDAVGVDIIFIDVEGPSGCTNRMPLGFEYPVQEGIELCGDGIDNDCDGLIDEAGCLAPSLISQRQPQFEQRDIASSSDTNLELIIFPNPSSGALKIQLSPSAGKLESIQLFNARGALMWSGSDTTLLADLPKGIYWIQVQAENQFTATQKWVKQ